MEYHKSSSSLVVWVLLVTLIGPAHSEEVVTITKDNFEEIVKGNANVIVEFYAPWCGHCKKLEPQYEEAAKKLKDLEQDVVLAKCDATDDANADLREKYGVSGFPTLKVFKGGEIDVPLDYNGPRDTAGIVDYVMRIIGPASQELEDAAAVDEFIKKGISVVGVFPGGEAEEFTVFSKAADLLREEAEFRHIFDASGVSLCRDDNCGSPVIFVSIAEDEILSQYEGDFNVGNITQWILKTSSPLLVEMSQDPRHAKHVRKMFQSGRPRLLGVCNIDYDRIKEFRQALIAVNTGEDDLDVMFVDPAKNERVLTFFSIKDTDFPVLLIHESKTNKKFLSTNVPPEDVKKFVADYKAGTLPPNFKSEDIPESNDEPVKVVVGKTFQEMVLETGKVVLLELYAPWCGHCKQLAPIYDEVGEHFKDNDEVIIAKMDGAANDVPDDRIQVKGFPTIVLFDKDGNIETYSGKREKEDIIEFVREKLEGQSETEDDSATEVEESDESQDVSGEHEEL